MLAFLTAEAGEALLPRAGRTAVSTFERVTRKPFPKLRPNERFREAPTFYVVNHTSVLADGEDMWWPSHRRLLAFELELACMLAKPLVDATPDVRPTDGGRTEEISGRFLVGCDGASSALRTRLRVPFEGRTGTQRWIVVDALVDRPLRRVPHPHVVGRTSLPMVTSPMSPAGTVGSGCCTRARTRRRTSSPPRA